MNRPPTRKLFRRQQSGFAWTAPYASWTLAKTLLQTERDTCDACDGVFWILGSYLLVIAVLFSEAASQAPIISTPKLVESLSNGLGMTTVSAFAIVAFWYFWPFVIRLSRTSAPKMTNWYPARPTKLAANVFTFALPALLAAVLAMFEPVAGLMFVLACLAVLLLLSGLRRRVGIDERCARCAYPVTTPRWSRGLCPECGRNLDARHAIILGHNTSSPARLAAGAGLTAAVFALAFVM